MASINALAFPVGGTRGGGRRTVQVGAGMVGLLSGAARLMSHAIAF